MPKYKIYKIWQLFWSQQWHHIWLAIIQQFPDILLLKPPQRSVTPKRSQLNEDCFITTLRKNVIL